MKELFSQQGVPEIVMSDNGPQYSASQFKEFAAAYGFTHVTSSPNYPQANGLIFLVVYIKVISGSVNVVLGRVLQCGGQVCLRL